MATYRLLEQVTYVPKDEPDTFPSLEAFTVIYPGLVDGEWFRGVVGEATFRAALACGALLEVERPRAKEDERLAAKLRADHWDERPWE